MHWSCSHVVSVVCWELRRAWLKALTLATSSISGICITANIMAKQGGLWLLQKTGQTASGPKKIFAVCFVFKHLQGQVSEQGTARQLARTARGVADFLLLLLASLSHTLSFLKGGKLWSGSDIYIQQGMFDLKFFMSQGCTASDKFTKYSWFIKLSNIFWYSRLMFSDKRQKKLPSHSKQGLLQGSEPPNIPFLWNISNFVHSYKA